MRILPSSATTLRLHVLFVFPLKPRNPQPKACLCLWWPSRKSMSIHKWQASKQTQQIRDCRVSRIECLPAPHQKCGCFSHQHRVQTFTCAATHFSLQLHISKFVSNPLRPGRTERRTHWQVTNQPSRKRRGICMLMCTVGSAANFLPVCRSQRHCRMVYSYRQRFDTKVFGISSFHRFGWTLHVSGFDQICRS